MKPVTKERILKAHRKLFDYDIYVNSDSSLTEGIAMVGIEYVMDMNGAASSSGRPRLEGNHLSEKVNEVVQAQFEKALRVNRMRYYIHKIQRKHGISGLVRAVSTINGGVMEHWEPDGELCMTEDDMWLLREDRPRITQFWTDHTLMSGLPVYRRNGSQWELSSIAAAEVINERHGWAYGWARTWEEVKDHGPGLRSPRISRELYLLFGDGIDLECPDRAEVFCATNEHL